MDLSINLSISIVFMIPSSWVLFYMSNFIRRYYPKTHPIIAHWVMPLHSFVLFYG